MLTIRMQRTGRKGLAQFRVVAQDSRFSPSSGRVVANLGHYNPHTKETTIDKEKIVEYIKNGAQPSERVVRLLAAEKVKLPEWVEQPDTSKKRSTKNPDKLRKHQPAEEEPAAEAEAPVEESPAKDEAPATEEAPEATEAEEKPADA